MENQANTADSSSRTTPQASRDSSLSEALPKFECRTVSAHCDQHGEFEAEVWKATGDWSRAECPDCKQEAAAAAEQEEAERKRRWEAEAPAREEQRWLERKRLVAAKLDAAGLPLRHRHKGFGDYQPQGDAAAKALVACHEYAESYQTNRRDGVSLILTGTAGTGKTHLACAIASHVIAGHLANALYAKAGDLLREVKSTYSKASKVTEDEVICRYASADLLIIDEVGVQFGTDAERVILFEIINARYERMLPTVLISNLALPALADMIGERVIDRMRENGGKALVFGWPSHRARGNA